MIHKFGFDKLVNKLPLHKLSAKMAYCMVFNILLLLLMLILTWTGKQIDTFPNAWDCRFILLTTIVVFFIGISDLFRPS